MNELYSRARIKNDFRCVAASGPLRYVLARLFFWLPVILFVLALAGLVAIAIYAIDVTPDFDPLAPAWPHSQKVGQLLTGVSKTIPKP